uniref:Dynamin stalk domain-containing protein n=1 Tax=Ditylenchus dipsaci TaxID=166011 RepID=A0A915EHM2_9BILA
MLQLVIQNYRQLLTIAFDDDYKPIKYKCLPACKRDHLEVQLYFSNKVRHGMRQPFFHLEASYENLQIEYYSEVRTKTLTGFISQIGGQLGLLMACESISTKLANVHFHINNMPPNSSEKLDKSRILLEIIAQFTESFNSAFGLESDDFETMELKPGARIFHILKAFDCNQEFIGIASNNFISELSFELLAKHQIRQLEKPSLRCVNLVYLELLRVVRKCGERQKSARSQFPTLFERIDGIVSELLVDRLRLTEQFVADLMEIEAAYVNCKNPDFIELVLNVVWEDRSTARCDVNDKKYAPVTILPPPSLYFEQQFQKYQAVRSFPSWKFGFFKQISKIVTSSVAMADTYPALPTATLPDNQDEALLADEDIC